MMDPISVIEVEVGDHVTLRHEGMPEGVVVEFMFREDGSIGSVAFEGVGAGDSVLDFAVAASMLFLRVLEHRARQLAQPADGWLGL